MMENNEIKWNENQENITLIKYKVYCNTWAERKEKKKKVNERINEARKTNEMS